MKTRVADHFASILSDWVGSIVKCKLMYSTILLVTMIEISKIKSFIIGASMMVPWVKALAR